TSFSRDWSSDVCSSDLVRPNPHVDHTRERVGDFGLGTSLRLQTMKVNLFRSLGAWLTEVDGKLQRVGVLTSKVVRAAGHPAGAWLRLTRPYPEHLDDLLLRDEQTQVAVRRQFGGLRLRVGRTGIAPH